MARLAPLLLTLLVLLSCASDPDRRGWEIERPAGTDPTLLVLNETGSHLAVILNGARIATVTARRQCVRLWGARQSGMDRLEFRVPARRAAPAPTEHLRSRDGWTVRLSFDNRLEQNALSLRPAGRC